MPADGGGTGRKGAMAVPAHHVSLETSISQSTTASHLCRETGCISPWLEGTRCYRSMNFVGATSSGASRASLYDCFSIACFRQLQLWQSLELFVWVSLAA